MAHLRRRTSGALAVRVTVGSLGASLLLAACSDADDPSGSMQAQEVTSSTSPTESGPTDAPSIQPATGPALAPDTGGISIRLPEGWTIDHSESFLVDGSNPHGWAVISVSSFPSLDPDVELTRMSRVALKHSPFPPGSIRPPVLVEGELAYHLVGKGQPPRLEEYGTVLDGDMLYVRFDLKGIPEDERQALIESVLATVEWS
ncbi:MAG TPA: hypothetical protein VEX15_13620 [Nocardioidaceae bacterium]|nr:hypothetical protein [Nocardioidaceae bacterium]